MLKRKAAFDAKQKGITPKTLKRSAQKIDETTAESPSPSSSSASSHKKQKPSPLDKQQHRDLSHYMNKQRTLILCSRGISFRDRHLMSDLCDLLPHSKKDNKLDTKHSLSLINELALLKNCNNVIFLESRKHRDLYLWLSCSTTGPSIKFQLSNVHTMAEVKMTGNHLKYSRPLLIFDSDFDGKSGLMHLALMKQVLIQCMGAPKGHPKVKPFIDHVFSFFHVDHRIWMRNYQIVYNNNTEIPSTGETELNDSIIQAATNAANNNDSESSSSSSSSSRDSILLVEVGPRLVLNPIRIFSGSFGGSTLWENRDYVNPNVLRAAINQRKGNEYQQRKKQEAKTALHQQKAKLTENEVDTVFQQNGIDQE